MLLTHTHTHRSNKRNDTHRHTEVRQGVGDAANTHPYTQIKQKERYTQAYRGQTGRRGCCYHTPIHTDQTKGTIHTGIQRSDRASGMLLSHTHTHRSNKRNDTHRHTEVRQGVGDAANTHPYTQIKQKERYTQAYRGQTGRRGCC